MRTATLTFSLFFLLTSPLAAQRQADGVYFLPAGRGEARVLTISTRRFVSIFRGAIAGEVAGVVSGAEHIADNGDSHGSLHFIYFDGAEVARVQTTFAVIDGRLWIGVFCPSRIAGAASDSPPQYYCDLGGMDFFGPAAKLIPSGQIVWDIEAETWTHNTLPQLAASAVTIKSVTMLAEPVIEEGAEDNGTRHIKPLFPVESRKTLETLFEPFPWLTGGGPGQASATPVGVFADKDWYPREAAKEMKLPEEKVAAALVKMTRVEETALRRGVYRQHGEVIITPWSIDLGPARLMPVKRPLAEVKGVWLGLDNPGQAVTVVDSKKDDRFPSFQVFGPPSAVTVRARFAMLPYDSAETLLHHQVIGENCGMGHVDWPGHIFWFATADDRLVRYIYPSTHTIYPIHLITSFGWESPVNRTQIFKRPK